MVAVPQPAPLRVGAYSRYSSHMQDEGWSIEAQHHAHEQEAAARRASGGQVELVWYDELAESAHVETIEARPVFARMLADAAADQLDAVWVHKMDRFSRQMSVTTAALERLHRAGVSFLSLAERFDLSTPAGWLTANLFAMLADFYSRNLAAEIKKGKASRARDGLQACRPPFGYRSTGAHTPAEPDLTDGLRDERGRALGDWNGLQFLFGLLLSGATDHEAATRLNADGRWRLNTPSRLREPDGSVARARLFTRQTISAIRRNVYYRPYQPGDSNGTITTPDGQEYRGQHVAACTWEDWHALQEIARGRRRGWYARETSTRYRAEADGAEFRGLAVCAGCGGRLYVWRTTHHGGAGASASDATLPRVYERYVCVAADRQQECAQDRHWARTAEVRAAWCAWLAANTRLPADWEARLRTHAMRQAAGEPTSGASGSFADAEQARQAERRHWQVLRERAIELYADGLKDRGWRDTRLAECDAKLAALSAANRHSEAHTAHLVDAGRLLTSIAELWTHMTQAERVAAAAKLIEPRGLTLTLRGRGQHYSRWDGHGSRPAPPPSCAIERVRLRAPFRELLGVVSAARVTGLIPPPPPPPSAPPR